MPLFNHTAVSLILFQPILLSTGINQELEFISILWEKKFMDLDVKNIFIIQTKTDLFGEGVGWGGVE